MSDGKVPITNRENDSELQQEPLPQQDSDECFSEMCDSEQHNETGVEADELFEASFSQHNSIINKDKKDQSKTSSSYKLTTFLPFLAIFLIQILPIHHWICGFMTGILIGLSSAFFLSLKIFSR